jgi:hypothetical protein
MLLRLAETVVSSPGRTPSWVRRVAAWRVQRDLDDLADGYRHWADIRKIGGRSVYGHG